jgi:hypothetical protein
VGQEPGERGADHEAGAQAKRRAASRVNSGIGMPSGQAPRQA